MYNVPLDDIIHPKNEKEIVVGIYHICNLTLIIYKN